MNDTSRAMRNTWRALKLFDELSSSDVKLYLAVSERMMDIKTSDGRMSLFMLAFFDEMYALDGSRRATDSIKHRKSKQITVGIPPFGTVRNTNGYLTASTAGAWKLPAGGWQAGEDGEDPPVEGAVWRRYFEAARRLLELYAENKGGYTQVAKALTYEGWAFRDRWNNPRLFSSDDVRRIVANWREYAGIVTVGRAKERVAHETAENASILYETGRAVFDLDLLRKVAQVQEERSVTTRPTGSVERVYPYGLLRLLYCARCEKIALEEDNPRRRSRLSGTNMDRPRYRHAEGVRCGCKRRSVTAEKIEGDFTRLVQLLTLKPEAHNLMLELAMRTSVEEGETHDLEAEKRAAIALLRQQLANLLDLYKNAIITTEEYYRDREDRERQFAFWEARATETDRMALELTLCQEAIARVGQMWNTSNDDDKQGLVRSLFEEIVLNLDTQRITSFKLKPWTDNFISLRAALYQDGAGQW